MISRFIGKYSLARKILDERAGQEFRFQGNAEIFAVQDGYRYLEIGTLQMPSVAPMKAERSYLWREAGDKVEVFFKDGRPFHYFDPIQGGRATEHLCGADWYRGGYELSEWPVWTVTWDVEGPRKLYHSTTTYTPC